MSLDDQPVLGLAMGTSQAVGYVNQKGYITGWLNELAFAPFDYASNAPLDHEWSGDRGTGRQLLLARRGRSGSHRGPASSYRKTRARATSSRSCRSTWLRATPRARGIFENDRRLPRLRAPAVRRLLPDEARAHPRAASPRARAARIILEKANEVIAAEAPDLAERSRFICPTKPTAASGKPLPPRVCPPAGVARDIARGVAFTRRRRRGLRPRRLAGRRALFEGRPTSASAPTKTTSRSWPTTASSSAFSRRTMVHGRHLDERQRQRARPRIQGLHRREMVDVRRLEQKKAAYVGEFSAMVLLNHKSASVKDSKNADVAADLDASSRVARARGRLHAQPRGQARHARGGRSARASPRCAACRKTSARRRSSAARCGAISTGSMRHRQSGHGGRCAPNLADALIGVFDSQICGGKRYDLAARGRRLANATFFESHAVDKNQALIWGIDLTPLVTTKRDPFAFVKQHIDRFAEEVKARIAKMR